MSVLTQSWSPAVAPWQKTGIKTPLASFIRVAIAAVVFAPILAQANAGTPLMWAGMLHLVFGNLVIGVAEGFLLSQAFGAPRLKSQACMIAANYVSAWSGALLLSGSVARSPEQDLYTAWQWFWGLVGAAYVLTLILELPFVAWAVRGKPFLLRRSFLASVVIQTLSYLVIFGWYWSASGKSLYTKAQAVPPSDLELPRGLTLFYISRDDGNVHRRPLASVGDDGSVYELRSTNRNDRLFVRPALTTHQAWDLVARLDQGGSRDFEELTIASNLVVEAAPDSRSTHTDPSEYPGTWFNFGEVPRLGSANTSKWSGWVGFWAAAGITLTHDETKEEVHIAYETPFGSWSVRNAVLLPGDVVVFQFGSDQICALEIATRKVALLCRGRGPVVISEGPPAPASSPKPPQASSAGQE